MEHGGWRLTLTSQDTPSDAEMMKRHALQRKSNKTLTNRKKWRLSYVSGVSGRRNERAHYGTSKAQ